MGDNKRIIGFDIARVISILIVLYYHILGYADVYGKHPVVRTFVYASLCIFTFLSAYLLASKYKFETKEEIKTFYKKRVLRFYPLFFISSILLYFLGVNGRFTTLKGLLGISPFYKPHPITMWYCAMLISLYLITPFWAKGGLHKQVLKFLSVIAVIILIDLAFHCVVPRTYSYFTVYFAGILISQKWGEAFLDCLKRYSILLMSIFIILVIITFITKNDALKYINSGWGLFALLSAYLKMGNSLRDNRTLVSVFTFLSYASMCMYLYHREVFVLMLRAWYPARPLFVFLYLGTIGVIISIVIAYYIQRSYDGMVSKLSQTEKQKNDK